MSFNIGPEISTEGLVLNLDPFENKSLPTKDLPVKDGLVLWLDGDDNSTFEILSGDRIGKWCDKSPIGNDYIQHSVDMAPVFSGNHLNGRQGIKFKRQANQSGERMTGNYTEVENYSIFWVMDAEGESRFHFLNDSAGNSRFYSNGSSQLIGFQESDGSIAEVGGWNYDKTISSFVMADDFTPEYYLTGSLISSPATTYNATFKINQLGNIRGAATSVYALDATINEILIFDRAVTSTERQQIHTYLGHKWGINNEDPIFMDLSSQGNNSTNWNNMFISNYNSGFMNYSSSDTEYIRSVDLDVSELSIDIWAKFKDFSAVNGLIGEGSFYRLYSTVAGRITWWVREEGAGSTVYFDNGSALSADQWYHFGASLKSNGVAKLYVNGELVNSSSTAFNFNGGADNAVIGSEYTSSPSSANAYIGPAKIYSRQLSDQEFKNNFEALRSRFGI